MKAFLDLPGGEDFVNIGYFHKAMKELINWHIVFDVFRRFDNKRIGPAKDNEERQWINYLKLLLSEEQKPNQHLVGFIPKHSQEIIDKTVVVKIRFTFTLLE